MKNSKLGFSLVELMVVIGIMGILAAIAVPRFQSYQAKAKKMEAINMLNQIYTLESVYFAEQSQYAVTNDTYGRNANANPTCTAAGWAQTIGFAITPCDADNKPVFQYSVNANDGFTATAKDIENIINDTEGGCTITINAQKVITDNCN